MAAKEAELKLEHARRVAASRASGGANAAQTSDSVADRLAEEEAQRYARMSGPEQEAYQLNRAEARRRKEEEKLAQMSPEERAEREREFLEWQRDEALRVAAEAAEMSAEWALGPHPPPLFMGGKAKQFDKKKSVKKLSVVPEEPPPAVPAAVPAAPRARQPPVSRIRAEPPVRLVCDVRDPLDVSHLVWQVEPTHDVFRYVDVGLKIMWRLDVSKAPLRVASDWAEIKTIAQVQKDRFDAHCERIRGRRGRADVFGQMETGEFVRKLRLTKKITTGDGAYLSEDLFRNPLQEMSPLGLRIYPLDEDQARVLGFEVSVSVSVEGSNARQEALKEARNAAEKRALIERAKLIHLEARGSALVDLKEVRDHVAPTAQGASWVDSPAPKWADRNGELHDPAAAKPYGRLRRTHRGNRRNRGRRGRESAPRPRQVQLHLEHFRVRRRLCGDVGGVGRLRNLRQFGH